MGACDSAHKAVAKVCFFGAQEAESRTFIEDLSVSLQFPCRWTALSVTGPIASLKASLASVTSTSVSSSATVLILQYSCSISQLVVNLDPV